MAKHMGNLHVHVFETCRSFLVVRSIAQLLREASMHDSLKHSETNL